MKSVRPRRLGALPPNLRLTPDEGFVLTRIDGLLTVRDLVALTGIDPPRVEQIVTKLASYGAVALEPSDSSGYLPDVGSSPALPSPPTPAPPPASVRGARISAAELIPAEEGTTSFADFAAVLGLDPSKFAAADGARAAAIEQPVAAARTGSRSDFREGSSPELALDPEPVLLAAPARDDAGHEANAELLVDDGPRLEEVTDEEEAADAEENEKAVALEEHDYRKIYEAQFHPLTVDVRAGLAKISHGPDLLALCLDADARVIAGILENPTCGLFHVRLIAFHHRTGVGLEMVTRRQDFLRDLLVERRLLRNPMAGDSVLQRVMASKRLFQTYKIAIDRDVPELTRSKSRGYMRQKYQNAPSEERADLVLRTEGRCLAVMTGCAFDAKMTGILCGRPYNSVLFIQNLAKFSATPPALLAHLMKQPFVRKHAPLKKLLLQHPNMPGDVKRQH
jgi:hypothetical protein